MRAQIPGTFVAGKTGTTENYGDAWFVGWTKELTVAVWVGYPDELRPMETEFNGEPVAGGTYPAAIWKSFMDKARGYEDYAREGAGGAGRAAAAGARDPGHAGADRRPRPRPRTPRPTGEGGTGPAPERRRRPAPEPPPRAAGAAGAAGAARQQPPSTGGGEAAPE